MTTADLLVLHGIFLHAVGHQTVIILCSSVDCNAVCLLALAIHAAASLQDYAGLVKTHRELDADITISTYSVPEKVAAARGLVRVDPDSGLRPPLMLPHWQPACSLPACC